MKIALVCKAYPTSRPGGMPFVCQDRARALVRAGFSVHVLTTGRESHRGEMLDDEGVEVHHMPCKPSCYSTEFANYCESHCKSWLPTVLHLDSFDSDRPWWKSRPGSPEHLAVTMHGFGWGAHFTKWNMYYRHGGAPPSLNPENMARERDLLLTFDKVIGVSLHEQWLLRDPLAIFDAGLVYNPISLEFCGPATPIPPANGNLRFLCSAVSGHHERGFSMAHTAAGRIGAELVVASGKPRSELPALIDSCHGLVLPTAYAQGCDLTVSEAIMRKRPCIVTATGSYLREGEGEGIYRGYLKRVPLADIEALAEAMRTFDEMDDGQDLSARWLKNYVNHPDVHMKKWLECVFNQERYGVCPESLAMEGVGT